MSQDMKRLLAGVAVALLLWLIWPTPWAYWSSADGWHYRRHRITGWIEKTYRGGLWH